MFRRSVKVMLDKAREIDSGLGRYAERLSRFIWPWRERWLLLVVGLLAILDFTSTYIVLELIKKNDVYERGPLAVWALDIGGFPFLLLVDIVAVLVLSLAAITARYQYIKHGHKDYGRAALVFLLATYVIIAPIAIVNNIIQLFR